MEKNFFNHQHILVDRFSYLDFGKHFSDWKNNGNFFQKFSGNMLSKIPLHIGNPKRGDAVVVLYNNIFYLKRIIALPGETIRIENGEIFIKTKNSEHFIKLEEPYLSDENKNETYLPFYIAQTDFVIPENFYWVMGDNRKNSSDSRNCFDFCHENSQRFIAREKIIGRVWVDFGYFRIFEENNFPKFDTSSWQHSPKFFNIKNSHFYEELTP